MFEWKTVAQGVRRMGIQEGWLYGIQDPNNVNHVVFVPSENVLETEESQLGNPETAKKPVVIGSVQYLVPTVLTSLYWVNNGPIDDLDAVYVKNRRIEEVYQVYETAEELRALLMGQPPTVGVCLNEGCFKLNFRPTGRVYCDVTNNSAIPYSTAP